MNAIVNLKVSPKELQVLDEALKMYAYFLGQADLVKTTTVEGYTLNLRLCDNNPYQGLLEVQTIRRGIGLI